MSAFVGYKNGISELELKALLDQYGSAKSRYFLRWAHKVSGILKHLDGFPSPEGQMFDSDREIRWKQQGDRFNVLMLSTQAEAGFTAIGNTWMAKSYRANLYPRTETRFPKGIQDRGVNIGQRCFIDDQTATVRFVALTVEDKS